MASAKPYAGAFSGFDSIKECVDLFGVGNRDVYYAVVALFAMTCGIVACHRVPVDWAFVGQYEKIGNVVGWHERRILGR